MRLSPVLGSAGGSGVKNGREGPAEGGRVSNGLPQPPQLPQPPTPQPPTPKPPSDRERWELATGERAVAYGDTLCFLGGLNARACVLPACSYVANEWSVVSAAPPPPRPLVATARPQLLWALRPSDGLFVTHVAPAAPAPTCDRMLAGDVLYMPPPQDDNQWHLLHDSVYAAWTAARMFLGKAPANITLVSPARGSSWAAVVRYAPLISSRPPVQLETAGSSVRTCFSGRVVWGASERYSLYALATPARAAEFRAFVRALYTHVTALPTAEGSRPTPVVAAGVCVRGVDARALVVQRRTNRVIRNEADLVAMLQRRYGSACTLYLEDFSVREQAMWMRSADAVVAAHGAGIANAIYMREGADFVQLYPFGIRWQVVFLGHLPSAGGYSVYWKGVNFQRALQYIGVRRYVEWDCPLDASGRRGTPASRLTDPRQLWRAEYARASQSVGQPEYLLRKGLTDMTADLPFVLDALRAPLPPHTGVTNVASHGECYYRRFTQLDAVVNSSGATAPLPTPADVVRYAHAARDTERMALALDGTRIPEGNFCAVHVFERGDGGGTVADELERAALDLGQVAFVTVDAARAAELVPLLELAFFRPYVVLSGCPAADVLVRLHALYHFGIERSAGDWDAPAADCAWTRVALRPF